MAARGKTADCLKMQMLRLQVRVQVSLREWNQDERFGAFGGSHAMVAGGYGQITDAYAAALSTVHVSCPVKHVRYNNSTSGPAAGADSGAGAPEGGSESVAGAAVTVTTREGETFDGDAVIISVPVGVLKAGSIVFEPELPAWKQKAMSVIGMGKLDKVRPILVHTQVEGLT